MYETVLLRCSYREDGKGKNEILANLTAGYRFLDGIGNALWMSAELAAIISAPGDTTPA